MQPRFLVRKYVEAGQSLDGCGLFYGYTYVCVSYRGESMWLGGYDLNLIWLILLFFVLFMVVFNGLIDLCEDSLPLFVVEAFRKTNNKWQIERG